MCILCEQYEAELEWAEEQRKLDTERQEEEVLLKLEETFVMEQTWEEEL